MNSRNTLITLTFDHRENLREKIKKIHQIVLSILINILFVYFEIAVYFSYLKKYIANKLASPVGTNLLFISSLTNKICKTAKMEALFLWLLQVLSVSFVKPILWQALK